MPVWIKLCYAAMLGAILPAYWHAYGPQNFLWLSDVALLLTGVALFTDSRWLASVVAVAALPLELAWLADFVTGGRAGIARYMFDPAESLGLRTLSGFHAVLPPVLIWMLVRFGYDDRALLPALALVWLVGAATWALTDPAANVNWLAAIRERGGAVATAAAIALAPIFTAVPTHLLLARWLRG